MIEQEVIFNKEVHRGASEFRNKKLKQFFDKLKPERNEFEELIIKWWANNYGKRF